MTKGSKKKKSSDMSIEEITIKPLLSPNKVRSPKKRSPHSLVSPKRSNKLYNHYRNKYCQDDIFQCIDPFSVVFEDITHISKFPIIGAGTFGTVFKSETIFPGFPVAIKLGVTTEKRNLEQENKSYEDMKKELIYSYRMGEVNIGPKVLDTFFYRTTIYELKKYYPVLFEFLKTVENAWRQQAQAQQAKAKGQALPKTFDPNTPFPKFATLGDHSIIRVQCIVMEAFDIDCGNLLMDDKISVPTKLNAIEQMVLLIKSQIMNEKLYCNDIKPQNFVAKLKTSGNYLVRMIDFGADFCQRESKIYKGDLNKYLNVSDKLLGQVDLLFISNVLQLFAMFLKITKNKYLSTLPIGDTINFILAFFYHLKNFFEIPNCVDIIENYIKYGASKCDLHTGYISNFDPANNLIWYSNLIPTEDLKLIYAPDNIQKIINCHRTIVSYVKEVIVDGKKPKWTNPYAFYNVVI